MKKILPVAFCCLVVFGWVDGTRRITRKQSREANLGE